ncbi:MAG: HD-GYP domain-containing protein [Thermoleophilia bacterium]
MAAVIFGPLPAMIVYAISMVGDPNGPLVRWVVFAAGRACVGAAAGVAALAFPVDLATGPFADVALSACAAALVAQAVELLWVSITAVLRSASVSEIFRAGWQVLLVEPPFHTTVVTIVVVSFQYLSFWAIVLVAPPVLLVQRLYVLYRDQRRLADRLLAANDALERANLSFSSSLIAALDARDRYTAGHSAAVAIYSRDIARAIGLSQEEQFTAHLAGLLHDVGKVGLPPGILEKAGPLTPQERLSMQEHSVIGERILRKVEAYSSIATIIRHHHEQFDGGGYPDGLAGEAIPLLSRIVAVSDAYNAMTSGRPYRSALEREVAVQRLIASAGSQFDPSIVSAFVGVLETASDLYSVGARADFAIEAQAEHQSRAELRPAA